ncbi:hypothetical protein DHW03_11895 [Pedobacter yonginense]|uniref:Uncharacterized protein n=1 Tax=Pedobacter yonginense TaxID=651869 RepID=A0A317EIS0_9SPHI|nr:hypothetical protein DHW03_11895 [Pedobacter yonginense]
MPLPSLTRATVQNPLQQAFNVKYTPDPSLLTPAMANNHLSAGATRNKATNKFYYPILQFI